MSRVEVAEPFWDVGSEPGRALVALGVAATLTAVTIDVVLVGRLTMFFDLAFVALCLALATLVRRGDFWTAGLLPPLLMLAVFAFLAVVARDAIAESRDNTVQAVVSGIAHHSAALLAGHALCLGCLGWRARREVGSVLADSGLEAGGVPGPASYDDGLVLGPVDDGRGLRRHVP